MAVDAPAAGWTRGGRFGRAILGLTVAAGLSACAIEPPVPSADLSLGSAALAPRPAYVLEPGDEIELIFVRTPELNVKQTISPSGEITLVGGVDPKKRQFSAAFMTTAELSARLEQAYSAELRDPDIAVVVRTYGSNRVYVTGEVAHPGAIALAGSMTALQAILSAEGFKSTAKTDEVLLIRPTGRRTATWKLLNLKKSMRHGDLADDYALEPHDIIYVPRSHIGNIDEFVDLYIRRLLPITPGIQLPAF